MTTPTTAFDWSTRIQIVKTTAFAAYGCCNACGAGLSATTDVPLYMLGVCPNGHQRTVTLFCEDCFADLRSIVAATAL